jgi:hypothetical protein
MQNESLTSIGVVELSADKQRSPASNFVMLGRSLLIDWYTMLFLKEETSQPRPFRYRGIPTGVYRRESFYITVGGHLTP